MTECQYIPSLLKPCPVCKSKKARHFARTYNYPNDWYVWCDTYQKGCGYETDRYDSMEGAREAWDTEGLEEE